MCATDEGKEKGEKWCKRAIWENTLPEVKHVWKSVDNLTSGVFVKMWQDQVDRFYTIASPRSNITAFLGVTVNGVRVVVTLMLRPGTTVSVADVTPRPPEPDAAESSKQHRRRASGTVVSIVEPVSGEPSLCFRETGFCKAETKPPK